MKLPTPQVSRHRAPRWQLHLLLVAALSPATAAACGGFFCSQVPVDQSGENILFAVDDETVTAHIQIFYTGEAEKFSWVLPLPALPTIGIGTDDLFTQLRARTDPRFSVTWTNSDNCWSNQGCWAVPEASAGGDDFDGDPKNSGVSVLAEGAVGPFDYKVVESTSGDALFTWLDDNGYDQPESAKPIVSTYVNQEYVFLALKLQKDKAAGDIQPVVLTYTSPVLACVPLKLTSIAATADMPVRSWILASARAIPLNYFHAVLNQKAYPWLDCSGGYWWGGGEDPCKGAYEKLVTDAADAANGHAFVTEYAGSTAPMAQALYVEGKLDLTKLAAVTEPMQFLSEMLNQGFPRSSLLQEVIRKWIPKPADLPEDCDEDPEFYTWNLETCLTYMPDDWTFDPVGMAADLEARVVEPAKAAQALFTKHPYMTRYFTTVSPDEMTKDPMFSFNPELGDVSNEHTVKATALCPEGSNNATEVRLEFTDGSTEVHPVGDTDCTPPVLEDLVNGATPYAEIQILHESGPPEVVAVSEVTRREPGLDLARATPGQSKVVQSPAVAGTIDGTAGAFLAGDATAASGGGDSSSAGCANTGRAPGLAWAGLLALLWGLSAASRHRR